MLCLCSPCASGPAPITREELLRAYKNGRWFDGSTFEPGILYVQNQTFTARRSRIDRVVDLRGAFVVPPFGEAHNCNVEPSPRVEEVIRRYLRAGVYYVANPNNAWSPSGSCRSDK